MWKKFWNTKKFIFYLFLTAIAGLTSCQKQEDKIDLKKVFLVSRKGKSSWASNKNIEGTTAEDIWLYPVVKAEFNGSIVYFSKADSVKVDNKKLKIQPYLKKYGPLNIQWYEVSPLIQRYDNTKSKGLDKIIFEEKPRYGGWKLKSNKKPGTLRYKVEVGNDLGTISSPGKENYREGLLPDVRRISLRENKGEEDNVDFMTLFFNTAYIFGNTAKQVNQFVGVDCQDLVIYSLNRTSRAKLSYDEHIHNTQKNQLIFDGYVGPLGKTYNKNGNRKKVKIKRGDIIRFPGRISGSHYGAIYEDNSLFGLPNGKLDVFDEIIHTLNKTQITRLGRMGIIRHKKRIQIYRM